MHNPNSGKALQARRTPAQHHWCCTGCEPHLFAVNISYHWSSGKQEAGFHDCGPHAACRSGMPVVLSLRYGPQNQQVVAGLHSPPKQEVPCTHL